MTCVCYISSTVFLGWDVWLKYLTCRSPLTHSDSEHCGNKHNFLWALFLKTPQNCLRSLKWPNSVIFVNYFGSFPKKTAQEQAPLSDTRTNVPPTKLHHSNLNVSSACLRSTASITERLLGSGCEKTFKAVFHHPDVSDWYSTTPCLIHPRRSPEWVSKHQKQAPSRISATFSAPSGPEDHGDIMLAPWQQVWHWRLWKDPALAERLWVLFQCCVCTAHNFIWNSPAVQTAPVHVWKQAWAQNRENVASACVQYFLPLPAAAPAVPLSSFSVPSADLWSHWAADELLISLPPAKWAFNCRFSCSTTTRDTGLDAKWPSITACRQRSLS